MRQEKVGEAIGEGEGAGFEDIGRDANGAPLTDTIAGFDEDSDAGGGASAGTDDAYLVIDQLNFTEGGEGGEEGFTQGGIKGVDGTVSLGGSFA